MPATTSYGKLAEYMDSALVEPARQMNIGRKLFSKVVQIPEGKTNIDYDTITEMGSAITSYGFPSDEVAYDDVLAAATNLKLAVIHKGFKIPRDSYESFVASGERIDQSAALSAAHVVNVATDDLLIQGWAPNGSTYKVNGLYQAAGNTDSTSNDFATYGKAIAEIAIALALLDADSIFGVNFNLVLNPVQFRQLQGSISSTGVPEWDKVMSMLNGVPGAPQGEILMSNDITAGTGMLSPVDTTGMYIDLVVAKELRTFYGTDSKLNDLSPIYGHVVSVLVPRIKHTNAICTITGI